jgi:MOSC domain-containing protein YiiM
MSGRLEAIWIKRGRRGVMDSAQTAELVAGRGIAGNTDRGGKRQVTIIEEERWNALMQELGSSLPPSTRRANLMTRGIKLKESRGRVLAVGNCRIRINGETRPCERMDEALPGLRRAMEREWSGGVYGEVLNDAQIAVGDSVDWAPNEKEQDGSFHK